MIQIFFYGLEKIFVTRVSPANRAIVNNEYGNEFVIHDVIGYFWPIRKFKQSEFQNVMLGLHNAINRADEGNVI